MIYDLKMLIVSVSMVFANKNNGQINTKYNKTDRSD